MKMCFPPKLAGFLVLLSIVIGPTAPADETAGAGDGKIVVSGEFEHSKVQEVPVTGAPAADEAAFHQEIYGRQFTITIPALKPGRYTVIIGLVENLFTQPGKRVFNITCGNQTIAQDLDIYAAAGGRGKVCYLTNTVDFTGAAARQPFALTFSASENNAKFNTVELQDATGQIVASLRAADLAAANAPVVAEDPAALKVPVVDGPEIWRDPSQPFDARVQDLVRRMSLSEKVSQIQANPAAIPRLGIPAYSHRNECHRHRRPGQAQ